MDKTVIITGGTKGIGRAIALKLARQWYNLALNYNTDKDAAQDTLKECKKIHPQTILIKGDVSNRVDVENIVKMLVDSQGNIDVLVNNAAIYNRGKFEEITLEDWDNVLSVNLTSCFNMCQQVIPHMCSGGKIIFMSSQFAFRGSSHGADYAATKAGMLGLMRSLALELAGRNICVNAVNPGTIDTDLLSGYTEEMRQKRAEEIPLGRLGTPNDVDNVCLFLASNLSDYVTGETISVNGGLYIH